jgi:tryptophan synthase
LKNNIDYTTVLMQLKEARRRGLAVPVLLMGEQTLQYSSAFPTVMGPGYYNPILAYGEDKAIRDASEAGANGFIMVDLPPEEAITFREKCANAKSLFSNL